MALSILSLNHFIITEVRARVKNHIKLSIATNALIKVQADKLKQIGDAQQQFLVKPSDLPEAKFAKYYLSLEEAGGDFYDVFRITDDIYGYFVADVSGHNISTSFITAALKVLLKQNCLPIYDPIESMKMINDVLLDVLPEGRYLTATYICVNRLEMTATIVNMGHPPILYCSSDAGPEYVELDGDVLGIMSEVCYSKVTLSIAEGERFFLYSDGLIERDSVWSDNLDLLKNAVLSLDECSLDRAVDSVRNTIIGETYKVDDDVLLLGIEV